LIFERTHFLQHHNHLIPIGFAFLEFERKEDAEVAVKGSNGRLILNQKIRAEISRRTGARGGIDRKPEIQNKPPRTPHRVKITGLPEQTSWKDLKEFLENEVNVVFLDFRGRGNAIAEFAESDQADSVVNALNNSMFQDHIIGIERDESEDGGNGHDHNSSNQQQQQRQRQVDGGSDGRGHSNNSRHQDSQYRGPQDFDQRQYNNSNTSRGNGRRSRERSRDRRGGGPGPGRSRSRDRDQYRGGGGGGYDRGDNFRRRY
jgi:RNA recognition motif-containing protein